MRRAGQLRHVGRGDGVAGWGRERRRPLIVSVTGRVCGNVAQYKIGERRCILVTSGRVCGGGSPREADHSGT
jgi:hypothetical protein